MQLHAAGFPGKLHLLPAGSFNQVVLDQHLLGKQPGDPARKALYEEAVKLFDKAKELDPNKDTSNWGYNRYNAYYNLYGENDARTKQAEAEK